MITESLEITAAELKNRTGWDIKPQGACKGEICVSLPGAFTTAGGKINLPQLAQRLRMPLIRDEAAGLWCLGPEAGGKALTTAQAPDFELPDWQGRSFRLSSLRGQKVLLVAWASW